MVCSSFSRKHSSIESVIIKQDVTSLFFFIYNFFSLAFINEIKVVVIISNPWQLLELDHCINILFCVLSLYPNSYNLLQKTISGSEKVSIQARLEGWVLHQEWTIVVVIVGMTKKVCWSIYCPSNMLPANHAMSSTMSLIWLTSPYRPACYQSLQVAGCVMVLPWTYFGALVPHCQINLLEQQK